MINQAREELSNKKQFVYDKVTGRPFHVENPNPHTVGHNRSRVGFKWHPRSRLGSFFQKTVKSAILKAIKLYSVNDFNEEQRRLYELLNKAVKAYIKSGKNRPGYRNKDLFMTKVAEIIVHCCMNQPNPDGKLINFAYKGCLKYDGEAYIFDDERLQKLRKIFRDTEYEEIGDIILFIMKEDSYYRARWIRMLQFIQPKIDEFGFNSQVFSMLRLASYKARDMEFDEWEIANLEKEKIKKNKNKNKNKNKKR